MADPRLRTTGTGETPALPVGPTDFSQTLGRGAGALLRLARESGHTGRLYGFDPAKRSYSRPPIRLIMFPRRPSITAIISIASPLT